MKSKQPSTKQTIHSKAKRRALLGAISTAGVVGVAKLPSQWTRPVVDHVLLPVHAATTDDTAAAGLGTSTSTSAITSNCVLSCTTAALLGVDVSTSSGAVWIVNRTYYMDYIQCQDSFGGFTSSFASSSSYSFLNPGTSFTSFYSGSGSSSYTSNGICGAA